MTINTTFPRTGVVMATHPHPIV